MSAAPTLAIPRNWTFESLDVAGAFDKHVREQLPWYDLATDAIGVVARHFIDRDGVVYDIGCSTGNIGRKLAPILDDRKATLIGIDRSASMREHYQAPGEFVCDDALHVTYRSFDVAVLFLTLMFVPLGRRRELLDRLRGAKKAGGCIIVFDRTEPRGGYVSTVLWRLALAGKLAAGVSCDEIVAKELSLAGVQRATPVEMLGGDAVEWFRFGDFAGYVIP